MLHARELNITSYGTALIDDAYVNYQSYALPLVGPIPSREICDEHNARLGSENWREHIYPWQQYARYRLLEDGTLLTEDENSQENITVTDEQTVQQILQMQQEDRETLAARDEYARQVAEKHFAGDKRAVVALRCAIEYYPGEDLPGEPDDENGGIHFYSVGRNASHSFYMGLRLNSDNTVSCFSASEGPDPDEYPEDKFSYREVEEFRGYYGHH